MPEDKAIEKEMKHVKFILDHEGVEEMLRMGLTSFHTFFILLFVYLRFFLNTLKAKSPVAKVINNRMINEGGGFEKQMQNNGNKKSDLFWCTQMYPR